MSIDEEYDEEVAALYRKCVGSVQGFLIGMGCDRGLADSGDGIARSLRRSRDPRSAPGRRDVRPLTRSAGDGRCLRVSDRDGDERRAAGQPEIGDLAWYGSA